MSAGRSSTARRLSVVVRSSGLGWAVALLVVLAGCAGYRELDAGQCLPDGAGVVGTRAQAPPTVPCSEPHRYEVFARRDLDPPSDRWPGDDLVELNARRLCGLAVRDATGSGAADLPDGVKVVQVRPTERSWRDGDREVECLFQWDRPTTDRLLRAG